MNSARFASPREPLTNARHAFRNWRRTRPFWGGLLVIVGASELLASEQAPLSVVTRITIQSPGAYLTPAFMLICGVLLWLTPIARIYHSVLAILLALSSWVTSNLGGFFIGMLIGAVGGALAFAWTTDAHYESSGLLRGKPRIGLPSRALDVICRLKALVGPQPEGRFGPTDSPDPAEPPAERSRITEATRSAHNLGPRIGVQLARRRRDAAQVLAAVGIAVAGHLRPHRPGRGRLVKVGPTAPLQHQPSRPTVPRL